MKEYIKKHWIVSSLGLLIIVSTILIFIQGLISTNNIFTIRINNLTNTLKSGHIIALVHTTMDGYGNIDGLIFGNLFLYIPAFLHYIGLSLTISYQIYLFILTGLTVFFTYFAINRITKNNLASVITTYLYTLSIPRLFSVFLNPRLDIIVIYMLLPLAILGMYEIIYGNYRKWYYFAVGITFITLVNITIGLEILGVLGLIFLINIKTLLKKLKRLLSILLSIIAGFLLGAFYFVPLIEVYVVDKINVFEKINVDSINTLLVGSMIIVALGLRILVFKKKINIKYDLLLLISILTLIPLKNTNLLMISSLFTSIIIGNLALHLDKKQVIMVLLIGSFLNIGTMFFSLNYLDNYLDIYNKDKTITTNNDALVYSMEKDRNDVLFTYSNNYIKDTYVVLPITYCNGYKVKRDGTKQEYDIIRSENNLVKIKLTSQSDVVRVYYKGTIIQNSSYIFSTVTFIGFIIFIKKKDEIEKEYEENEL